MNQATRGRRVNWHQATAEVVLILTGVLVALAVDSWWDERSERLAEVDYLRSLQSDFEENKRTLEEAIAQEDETIELGEEILDAIQSGMIGVDQSELTAKIDKFYYLHNWQPITGTYDEMVGAGRLLYLRNRPLRIKLSGYMQHLDQVRVLESWQNRQFQSAQSPFLRNALVISEFSWLPNPRQNERFSEDLAMLKSKEFWNLVSLWITAHHDHRNYGYKTALALGDEILMLIELELAKQGN